IKNRKLLQKEKQKEFQDDIGLPIHLKGGSSNFLLYGATMTRGTGAMASSEKNLLLFGCAPTLC
uniref:Uncharacterized protein n=1 Tax=Cynoglossus semilaevis TaxID=244447 RepID=A0A3P8VA72_CYNSE